MATIEKIRNDIAKTKDKIADLQKKQRALEAQLAEEETLEIVRMVKAVKMDNKELTAFLKAYASGLITLPEDMMAEDRGDEEEPGEMEGYEEEAERILAEGGRVSGNGAVRHGLFRDRPGLRRGGYRRSDRRHGA